MSHDVAYAPEPIRGQGDRSLDTCDERKQGAVAFRSPDDTPGTRLDDGHVDCHRCAGKVSAACGAATSSLASRRVQGRRVQGQRPSSLD